MAKDETDARTQRQKSIDKARELGAEHSDAIHSRARERGMRASGANGKKTPDDGKTQHQRFVEAARALGADEDPEVLRRVVRAVATAPTKKVKKAAKKRARKKS